jgi:hypothetical protein
LEVIAAQHWQRKRELRQILEEILGALDVIEEIKSP